MSIHIKIRAHHLLCMQGFQGYGYSQDFAANMQKVIETINSSQNPVVEIVAECDVICSHCPHNMEEVCWKGLGSAKRIRDMDLRVLEKLGLREGTKVKGKDIFDLVNTRLGNVSDVNGICGKCEWMNRCVWYLGLGH